MQSIPVLEKEVYIIQIHLIACLINLFLQLAKQHSGAYVDTSAKTKENIHKVKKGGVRKVFDWYFRLRSVTHILATLVLENMGRIFRIHMYQLSWQQETFGLSFFLNTATTRWCSKLNVLQFFILFNLRWRGTTLLKSWKKSVWQKFVFLGDLSTHRFWFSTFSLLNQQYLLVLQIESLFLSTYSATYFSHLHNLNCTAL